MMATNTQLKYIALGVKMEYEVFEQRMAEKFPRYFGEGCHYGGFAIGEGWYHIIELLVGQIDAYTKWKRSTRAYDLRYNRAWERGYDAMLKFVLKGKDPELATEWQLDQAQQNIEGEPRNVTESVEWIQVHQIKEKFGGLRFYYQGGDNHISGLVDMAETWAGHTCETCGNKGERRSGGWVRTLCDHHEELHQSKLAAMKDEDE